MFGKTSPSSLENNLGLEFVRLLGGEPGFLFGMCQAAELSLGLLWLAATFLLIILVWQSCFSRAGLQGRVRIKSFVSVSPCDQICTGFKRSCVANLKVVVIHCRLHLPRSVSS